MKKKGIIALILACSFTLGTAAMSGCNIIAGIGGNDQNQTEGETVSVKSVSLNKNTLTLKEGTSERLTATVNPTNADNKSVSWRSDKPEIATVDQSGNVTAVAEGTAVITVTTADGNKTDSCTVTVSKQAPATVSVTGVNLDKDSATVKVNGTVKLNATVLPTTATNKNVSWGSSNQNIATVDENGLVTAKAVGSAIITVTTEDGKKTDTCTVTVEALSPVVTPVSGVSLNKITLTLKVGASEALTHSVTPATATNKSVSWSSDKPNIASVDQNGSVTAIAAGAATITVTTEDGNKTASCVVTVEKNATEPVVDAKISYSYAGNECAAFEWGDSNAAGAKVEYKLASASTYTELTGQDKQFLVRQTNADTARVDLVGLKGGAVYDFKITPSSGSANAMTVTNMTINSYDRSGYAHFNKSDGVGAYKDDGTAKSGAVIVYVNEENKNTVTATVNGSKRTGIVDILKNAGTSTPLIVRIVGTVGAATWTNLTENNDKALEPADVLGMDGTRLIDKYGITVGTTGSKDITQETLLADGMNTLNYYPEAYGGERCDELIGLSSKIKYDSSKKEFDSAWNDCTISGVKNVTVEGVGEDARIFQWGMTFKNSSSIEVRNLTFEDYTEDACSFEGSETSASSLSSFKSGNIWVHHNTFEEGVNYWDVCNEQDKHDGDGSTDFKGLKNITLSYNVYNGTHKTGLIGGSNSQTTANVTFHHNAYNGCKSRLPLARQANMHMYNNYYNGTTSTDISLRAGAYAFVENCYFSSTQSVNFDLQHDSTYGDGAAKVIGCVFAKKNVNYATGVDKSYFSEDVARSAIVSNGNKFSKTFDTDSSLFYYDSANQKSDVEVMFTAEETKTYVPLLAGVQKRGGDVTLGGSGSGSGSTGGGTETPEPTPTPGETVAVDFISQFDTAGKALEITNSYFTIAGGKFKLNTDKSAILPNSDSTNSFTVTATTDVTVVIKLAVSSGNALNTADSTVTIVSSNGTAYSDLTFTADSSKLNGKEITLNLKAGEVITITRTGTAGRINLMAISYKV